MTKVKLYRFLRTDGGTTISTQEPSVEYTTKYRLIAAPGKILTDGENTTYCIDTDSVAMWSEIDDVKTNESADTGMNLIFEKAEAYDILMGVQK